MTAHSQNVLRETLDYKSQKEPLDLIAMICTL